MTRATEDKEPHPVVFEEPDRAIGLQASSATNHENRHDKHGRKPERSSDARDNKTNAHPTRRLQL